jgi:hypothetical protein
LTVSVGRLTVQGRDARVGSTANSDEILSKLAEGGMAEIFLARAVNTTGLRRHVVLKWIARERALAMRYVRFLDEARLARPGSTASRSGSSIVTCRRRT